MMTNMPRSYATYPLSQTSDRSKNRLAVFAVKLRESMKAYLSEKDDWPISYYSELLLDTLLEDLTSTEIKDLDVWYGKHEMQEEVNSVSYKMTTDDKFLQNMMRSVDALPAKTEANLESVNGRSAEFFKTSVLYARRKLIPRLSFETSVIYRGTYGRKIPLSSMDDSCMILWWVKNKRPYQLFVTSSRDFMDVQRRMPASKISMVTFWSGRTSEVAQGGITMRDSATAGLGDQPPAPPRTLEQIPLQELYRPVPEEVLPPVTPPPVPAEQLIEVDDEDMQPPDQPQQSMQPPLTPPHGGLHVPLPDSPMQDSIPGSPGPPQDPPPPSPPPALKSRLRDEGLTLNEFLENRTIGDIVDQFTQEENADWLRGNDFFMGNNGHFAPIREVSEGSHDVTMAETVSDVSMPDAEGAATLDTAATLDESGATIQSATSQETAGLSSSSASAPRTVLGAEAPPGLLLAIEDIKPDEFYQASNQIRSALQNLPEQLQNQEETQLEVWVHSTDRYDTGDLWTDVEYAKKACDRTGARIYFAIQLLSFGPEHPHMKPYTRVAIQGLLPYLDDYIMGEHDPFVEDFHWSMDDNRHTESQSPELTEGDVPNLLLFAPKEVIDRVRSQATSSSEPAMRRDLRGSRNFGQAEIKRHRQGLRVDELSSTDVLDVAVFNLGNLARQSVQRQAEPRMLRLIMNQTSHIMMLVEGTSLAVNQWDEKLRAEGWTLGSSDDHHHWVGVRTASVGTTVTPLVDNCGSTHQKIWYAIFDVRLGNTSDGRQVWKGGQNFYRVMVVHVNHLVARTACRSCRINFADLLMLCAHFQVDLMGGDFNAFSYRYYRSGGQQIAASLQDSSLAVMLRRFDEAINAKRNYVVNHPEYKFKSDLYMAYHDEHIEEYRLMREAIMEEVTDAAREATKIPRLQRALQEFDENFDVIGLINFNWDHTVVRAPSHLLSGREDARSRRARSSRTSMPFVILLARKRCADCRAWLRRSHRSYCSFVSETMTCTRF